MVDQEDNVEEVGTQRQNARRQQKKAGKRSAKVARELMELTEQAVMSLKLSGELQAAVQEARSVKSKNARRREERHLAAVLREVDLVDVESKLLAQSQSGRADGRMFKRAEGWRTRMIEEGQAAVDALKAELPGLILEPWHELIANAQAERDLGSHKGASKILFRQIMTALRAAEE